MKKKYITQEDIELFLNTDLSQYFAIKTTNHKLGKKLINIHRKLLKLSGYIVGPVECIQNIQDFGSTYVFMFLDLDKVYDSIHN